MTTNGYATITANQNNPGPVVPQNFVGFSSELQDVISNSIFTPANTSLINLIKTWLGPSGIWRIGGNSGDTNPPPALSQQIANNAAGFIAAVGSGWKTIYGLDAFIQDPNLAATHVSYLLQAFPPQNIAFQVGNEPEALPGFGSAQSWASVFNNYYVGLNGSFPNLKFAGPDTVSLSDTPWINSTIPGAPGVAYVTGHKYTLGSSPISLSPDQVLADATVAPNPGVIISEFGILAGGGQQGITDRLLAATYYLKLAQSAFAGGYAAILPHNVLTPYPFGGGLRLAYYNQFIQQPDGWSPAPMFYGMLLFQALAGQTSISTTTTNLNPQASVTATLGPNGNANLLVVNGDTVNTITVQPQQTHTWSTATIYLVSGNGWADPNPVFNGKPIGEGGALAYNPIHPISISNGDTVSISPCGAALIVIQPYGPIGGALFSYPMPSGVGGWSGQNGRWVFTPAAYQNQVTGSSMKIKLVFTGATSGQLDLLWVGYLATGSNYNFDGNQVQAKFSGNGSLAVVAGIYTSDAITFANFDPTKTLVIAAHFSGSDVEVGTLDGITGVTRYYNVGADSSSQTAPSASFTATAGALRMVTEIDLT